jgi:diguanylate cyclase (GGDEF)-like protein
VIALSMTPAAEAAEARPIRFDRISIDDGLSQATILAMRQDSMGFMWFGTEEGLDRFDGYEFTHYRHDPADPASISCSYVWAIEEDSNGDLWLGTDGGGISRWNRATDTFVNYSADDEGSNGTSSGNIRALRIAPSGLIWIATRKAGLNSFDPVTGAFTHYRHDPSDPSSLGSDNLFGISIDSAGVVWVATDDGLDRLNQDGTGFTHYRNDPADPTSISSSRVRSVAAERSGALWVGTLEGGLNRLDSVTGTFDRFEHDPADARSISSNRVRAILEDEAGRLWIGTGDGLNLLDPVSGGFSRYGNDPADVTSLSTNDVISLYQDRGGVVWVGTQLGGVNRWNPAIWSFGHRRGLANDASGLTSTNVTSFSEDRAGQLWIGTVGGGVNVLDRVSGEYRHYGAGVGSGDGLSTDNVMALLNDHRGETWVGTLDGGVNRFNPADGTFTHYRHDPADPSSLGSDGVMSLFEDHQGVLWVGTFGGGLNRFDRATGAFARFTHDENDADSISSDRVTCIAQAPGGRLWIGTDAGGLNLFEPRSGSFTHFRNDESNPDSISSDTIFALRVDPSGRLWIGTRGGGLGSLAEMPSSPQNAVFSNYSTKDGLSNDTVYGIVPDTSGSLWMSTNRGLSRFDRTTGSFRNFRFSHGLQADEFNFGAHYRSTSGELMFGGINGFNAFFPERIETNTAVPPVVMTSYLKFNKPAQLDGPVSGLRGVDLGFRDDVVTFEFSALDFTAPSENRYAYMLEGFDDEWIDLGTVRRVTFTDLDGGDYVLRVRGANNEGVWNEAGLAFNLTVAPPPWKTWWAYTLYTLMLGAVVVGAWRFQQRKLQREEEYSGRLEEEVRERTGELETRAQELQSLNQQLVEASLTDSLTGLRNRRFLFEQVAKDIALVRRRYYELAQGIQQINVYDLVFMMVDLDHFKPINDNFGHAAGDQVLVDVRGLLLNACRDSDIVIRWGGDEFLVIGRDADPEKAETLAERIRSSIEDNVFELEDGQVARTTCSVGFACFPFVRDEPDALPWEQTLALADAALYTAKNTSRNAWVGYLSTPECAGRIPEVAKMVRDDPHQMRQQGLLEIRSSIPAERWVIQG